MEAKSEFIKKGKDLVDKTNKFNSSQDDENESREIESQLKQEKEKKIEILSDGKLQDMAQLFGMPAEEI